MSFSISKSLRAKFNRSLRTLLLLPRHSTILIAVSGGQDSLCLLHLLRHCQPQWQWQLAIGHCDHQWRSDSSLNAQHIDRIAQEMELPFFLRTALKPLTSESAAREWRYEMLQEMAQAGNCTHITTGHTRTDRAETLLFNLWRGTGLEGLQSLHWQRSLPQGQLLVRPLLGISRAETARYCTDNQLPIWVDSTNDDLTYRRNRIRHELLPYLKTHFNPQIEQSLAQTAEIIHGDLLFLEASITAIWQKEDLGSNLPRIDRTKLQAYPHAVQRRLLRRFLAEQLPEQPNFSHVEKVVALLTAPQGTRCDPLPGKGSVIVDHPWLWLQFDRIKKLYVSESEI